MNSMIAYFILLLMALSQAGLSQVAINTSGANADPSSMLDVNATDKGLLIPRVSLSGVANNILPIYHPAAGLLVYNIEGNSLSSGIYVWNGTIWESLATLLQVLNALPGPPWSIGPGVYGEMFEYHSIDTYSSISVPASGTYVPWISAEIVEIYGISYTSSTFMMETSGVYSVAFNSVVRLSVNEKIVDVALFVNGIRQDDLHGRAGITQPNISYDISFSGIITLLADDLVTVCYTMNDGGVINVEIANFSLTKIAD